MATKPPAPPAARLPGSDRGVGPDSPGHEALAWIKAHRPEILESLAPIDDHRVLEDAITSPPERMEPGLRTKLRMWDPNRVADLPGRGARATYLRRLHFLDVVNELFPDILRELAALRAIRNGVTTDSPPTASEVARVLDAHKLSAQWIRDAARTTLRVWSRQRHEAEAGLMWCAEAHLMNEVGRNEMGAAPLEWNVLLETEEELRKRFEALVSRRKIEALRAGYVQVSQRRRRPPRLTGDELLRLLALHVVRGVSYRAIADECAAGIGGRPVEISESALQQSLATLARELDLPLPGRRSRGSTTGVRVVVDEGDADVGGGLVELSASEVQQLVAKLAGESARAPARSGRRSTTS